MDLKAINELCADLEKKEGKGSVYKLGSKNSSRMIPRWSTGIEDLDNAIGGGIPQGRIIEIFGAESAGKTTLALWLAHLVEKALYIPTEGTFDTERALQMGNTKENFLVYQPDYGEQALNQILKFAKAGIPLIILDSVPATQPREDIEKLEKDAQNQLRLGGVAALFAKMLPTIVRTCEMTGTTLILINQVRDNIGAVMAFGDKDTTPGGRAIRFYSSIRIKVARRAWVEVPNKNPANSAANEKIGMIMKCRVVKSKVSNPYLECEIPLLFDRGFTSFGDLQSIRQEIMKANRSRKSKAKDDDQD